uniref:Bardet-Biedl syndrome 7 protein homolog n=1 Tax=Macrostomum lignano TaxID=282301 RepID=A0A1I8INF6_9PLAT
MMDINFSRLDYLQVGVTTRNCMKLLPPGSDGLQKVCIGDRNGALSIYSLKSNEPKSVFSQPLSKQITRVDLAGKDGQSRDRIFVASGSEIRGFSRNGKQFVQFDTNMTENIRSIAISNLSDLYVAGNTSFSHFKDLKDQGYLLCPEVINDILVLPSTKLPVLACKDRSVKIVEVGTAAASHRLTGFYDITGDGMLDLIVAREDGSVEVYAYDIHDKPVLRWSYNCNETITAMAVGVVNEKSYDEIVCSTYGGWIFGLTRAVLESSTGADAAGVATSSAGAGDGKLDGLREEIGQLQQRVEKERDKYQTMSTKGNAVSSVPLFDINDRFILTPVDAAYTLTIECQAPIDNLLLQSDVPVDIMDTEKNSAVVSLSAVNPDEGNHLLATYRCQANTTRLEIKVRTIEGHYGTLMAYVTPRLQPKVCQLLAYHIKPLSLHRRAHELDESRPLNSLTLTGAFSLAEIHHWVAFLVGEVPEKAPADEAGWLVFENTFLGTQFEARYKKGEAVFRSDNLSTISIIKECLSKEATKRKIALQIGYEVNDQSVSHTIRLIAPKLESLLHLAKRVALIEPLRELMLSEQSAEFLSEEFQQILLEADELQR